VKVSERIYNLSEVVSFSSTKSKFGGLSNMAPGFSLFVNEVIIPNSEALYQACRFPLFPELQEEIIKQVSPMDAKRISRENSHLTRQDWEVVKLSIMRWCIMVKLVQNREMFGRLLQDTGEKSIVEYSKKDKFWGASPIDSNTVQGVNALGRLLMDVREKHVMINSVPDKVTPLNIPAFLLFNLPIAIVHEPSFAIQDFENDLALEMA
jgi:ribA/ribD-fused uncharacterized protein